MDFPLILVIATFVTGIIWLIDVLFLKPKRKARLAAVESQGAELTEEGREQLLKELPIVEYSRSFFPIILIVLLLRSFVVEPFRIPSNSMMPTLLTGDFILVNKFAYGLRLPVTHTKFLDLGEPQRGDVVVFRYPRNPSEDYIKRVVGVPGDIVRYQNKVLTINGVEVAQIYRTEYEGVGSGAEMTGVEVREETLNGVVHDILVIPPGHRLTNGERFNPRKDSFQAVVPEGHYFAMGDNRDRSGDSRYWGFVPEENLVGKAFMIWMNFDWKADSVIDWSRIGNDIQ